MGKAHKHPEHENLERWLVSYADFITLLFATFTALFAIAQADLAKMSDVAVAISQGFEQQSLMHGIETVLQGKSPPQHNPDAVAKDQGAGDGVIGQFKSMTYMPGEVERFEEEVIKIRQYVEDVNEDLANTVNKVMGRKDSGDKSGGDKDGTKAAGDKTDKDKKGEKEGGGKDGTGKDNEGKAGKDGKEGKDGTGGVGGKGELPPQTGGEGPPKGMGLAIQERGVKVTMDSSLFFEPGTAILKPESVKTLDGIAKRLQPFNGRNLIHVEGHTDSQPIATGQFPSNWELSAARAGTVVRRLIQAHHFDPAYLAAIGYGASRPVAPNDTPNGREKNRRIDIVVYSKTVENEIDPSKQARHEKTVVKTGGFTPTVGKPHSGPVKLIFQDTQGGKLETVAPVSVKAIKLDKSPVIKPIQEDHDTASPVKAAAAKPAEH